MGIIANVSAAVQALFGTMAEEVAKDHPVVLRHRKFTTATLAQTFILGFLAKPRASDEELAQTAALCGVEITAQAIEQRHTARLAGFLEALFRKATQSLVKSQKTLAPLLDRFAAVLILDSTTTTLPDALRDRFPGCGGSHGGGQAAMKLQAQWDLKNGQFPRGRASSAMGATRDYKHVASTRRLASRQIRCGLPTLGYFDTRGS